MKLSDSAVRSLPIPATGNKIFFDDDVKGFGARVTANGSRAFVLVYRTKSGRQRRYTIGAAPDWRTSEARAEAKRLKQEIRVNGLDPVGKAEAIRAEPTMADLCARYIEEHLPKKRSQRDDLGVIRRWVLPALKHAKVAEVTFADIDALHRKITKAGKPYRANRTMALLSKMFSLSIRWKMRTDNPAREVEHNDEAKRARYLSPDELLRLTAALAAYPDQEAADVIRLLLLTGARRGEVLAARWAQFDLDAGVWTKPASTTKQKKDHRVPLSAPARQLITGLQRRNGTVPPFESDYLFPGANGTGHRFDIKRPWAAITKEAGITGLRVHDLRHSYASILAGAGLSLPIIGALLGHASPATTARYAHLMDDPLRAATERAGAIISGRKAGKVMHLKKR
jgi:integrase